MSVWKTGCWQDVLPVSAQHVCSMGRAMSMRWVTSKGLDTGCLEGDLITPPLFFVAFPACDKLVTAYHMAALGAGDLFSHS